MAVLLDTSVAIALLDGTQEIVERRRDLVETGFLSVVSCVELIPGLYEDGQLKHDRAERLTGFLDEVELLPFTFRDVDAYDRIIAHAGFSRRLVIDRMIAAAALANDLSLATLNPRDFRNIPRLTLDDWNA